MKAEITAGGNKTGVWFRLVSFEDAAGHEREGEVRLTLRVDIEDRNFHQETERNGAAEFHLQSNSKPLTDRPGFAFTPATDRNLRVYASAGAYFHEGEWSRCSHYVESTRGQKGFGDAYSPGWFDLPAAPAQDVIIVRSE